jgi:hypothetical protein
MNYTVRPAARRDLIRIWRIIRADNPDAAERFLAVAEQTFAEIARQPALTGHGLPCVYCCEQGWLTRGLNALGLWRLSFHPILVFRKPVSTPS